MRNHEVAALDAQMGRSSRVSVRPMRCTIAMGGVTRVVVDEDRGKDFEQLSSAVRFETVLAA